MKHTVLKLILIYPYNRMFEVNFVGKKQHIIPQFYQKYWESENLKQIWEYNKKYKTIKEHSIVSRNQATYIYEPDVNEPSNAIENWYSCFETKYSIPYRMLINSIACKYRITYEEKRLVCRLFCNFSARNPFNVYKNQRNNALASKFTLGIDNKVVDRRSIQNMLALSEGGMYEIFGGDNAILGEFERELLLCNVQFLFSDKPNIIFCDNIIEQVCYQNEYYFPISPNILAFFTHSIKYEDGRIRSISDTEYDRFVKLYLNSNLVERIYASSHRVLSEISQLQIAT